MKALKLFNKDLRKEFEKRGPWITKFNVNGKEYGGDFDAMNDRRIDQFYQYFPDAKTILELGSFEGGHTLSIAKRNSVKKVIGVEGRRENINKAKFVQELLGIKNVKFVQSNLEDINLSEFGHFDVVFCSGVLYHLPKPWELIEKISGISENIFIWTHFSDEKKADTVIGEYKGMMWSEGDMCSPLSGLSPKSFWFTLDSLEKALKNYGFKNIHHVEFGIDHPDGPCLTFVASMNSILES